MKTMKKMKRIITFILAMIMALGTVATVFAAQEKGSIRVENEAQGQTYTYYKLLSLESYNKEANAYAYKMESSWEDFLMGAQAYIDINDQGYVTWKANADAAAFAKAALEYAKNNDIDPDGTLPADNLELGYYLVDSSLGALCNLTTTNPNAVIQEKNEKPENVKTVEESMTNKHQSSNTANIGDTINYKSTITVKSGAENYVLHDKMSEGLTFDGVESMDITADGVEVDSMDYMVVTSDLDDGCTFEVRFKNAYLATLEAGTKIVVAYSATLNEKAVIGLDGNTNESRLSYGNGSEDDNTTPPSETKTYTWRFDLLKYTGANKTPLADATFTLSRTADGSMPIELIRTDEENTYRVAMAQEREDSLTEITTDASGRIKVEGLDAATYYLTETAAPAGYNKLAAPVIFTIKEDGQVIVNNTEVSTVEVENNTGTILPSTGGMGTTLIYIMGSILVLLASVLLISRKKMMKN